MNGVGYHWLQLWRPRCVGPVIVPIVMCYDRDESRDTDDSVSVLGSNTAFLCHLVAVALQKLQQISEHGKCDGTTCTWDKLFQKCCIVGR